MTPTNYDIEITFCRAANLPIADLHTLSSDAYVQATVLAHPSAASSSKPIPPVPGPTPLKEPEEPTPTFRTPPVKRSRNPEWCTSTSHSPLCAAAHSSTAACTTNGRWIVGGVPASGFQLNLDVRSSRAVGLDPALGHATVLFPNPESGGYEVLHDGYVAERVCTLKPRGKTMAVLARALPHHSPGGDAHLVIQVRVIRCSESASVGMYTLGPHTYSQHTSRLIGTLSRLSHPLSAPPLPPATQTPGGPRKLRAPAFTASALHLGGSVPREIRCSAGTQPGSTAMARRAFEHGSVRGAVMRRALRAEHCHVYAWAQASSHGVVSSPEDYDMNGAEGRSDALARRFVHIARKAQGRVCTYALTADGDLRWADAGAGAGTGADMVSKHAMLADGARRVAFAGEMYLRRREADEGAPVVDAANEGDGASVWMGETGSRESVVEDEDEPALWEVVLDNASGTYTPTYAQLVELQTWLSHPARLGALGAVTVRDTFDPEAIRDKAARTVVRGHGAAKVRTARRPVEVEVRETETEGAVEFGEVKRGHGKSWSMASGLGTGVRGTLRLFSVHHRKAPSVHV